MQKRLFEKFENGVCVSRNGAVEIASLPWNAHKDFEGVYLKHCVSQDMTGGLFTCLLVRIEPGKKIGMHTHTDSIELHEVISGDGVCVTEFGDIAYEPGRMAVLPAASAHEVLAGENGLCLFAKFINTAA